MICTPTFIYIFVATFIVGNLTTIIYASYFSSIRRPPICIILIVTLACTIVLWMLTGSTCCIGYILWGAFTTAVSICLLVNEIMLLCFKCCIIDVSDECIV